MAMDDELAAELLKSIGLTGSSDADEAEFKPIIANKDQGMAILNLTSGLPRIGWNHVKNFEMIHSQPLLLKPMNPFEIRCCLCSKVISYPCWYHDVRYAVNWFHYFVCFDANQTKKVTARCFKRR